MTGGPGGPAWQRSAAERAQIALIAGLGYPVLSALGSTYRYELLGGEHVRAAEAIASPIYACWHGRILGGTIFLRGRNIVVITSRNFDGEWIARILHRFGFDTARGSSTRGSRAALRQLMRDIHDRAVAFTVDGPRGPNRVAQPGAVWLAKATGHPVLPFHVEAKRHWTLRSWDRAQIPRPFSRLVVTFGEPFVVPRRTDDLALDQYRLRLESALAGCEATCLEALGAVPTGAPREQRRQPER